jgi:hypothetical protein
MLSGGQMAQTNRPLQVGGHHRFQLLHHAQPPLHFRHNSRLLGEGWNWNFGDFDIIDCYLWLG